MRHVARDDAKASAVGAEKVLDERVRGEQLQRIAMPRQDRRVDAHVGGSRNDAALFLGASAAAPVFRVKYNVGKTKSLSDDSTAWPRRNFSADLWVLYAFRGLEKAEIMFLRVFQEIKIIAKSILRYFSIGKRPKRPEKNA